MPQKATSKADLRTPHKANESSSVSKSQSRLMKLGTEQPKGACAGKDDGHAGLAHGPRAQSLRQTWPVQRHPCLAALT